jgi:hypothetical protein
MRKAVFVIDPIDGINLKKDSTLAIIRAAQRLGWDVRCVQQGDLFYRDEQPWGFLRTFSLSAAFAERLDPAAAYPDWYCLARKSQSRCATATSFSCARTRHSTSNTSIHLPVGARRERRSAGGESPGESARLQREVLRNRVSAVRSAAGGHATRRRHPGIPAKHKHIVLKPLDGMAAPTSSG